MGWSVRRRRWVRILRRGGWLAAPAVIVALAIWSGSDPAGESEAPTLPTNLDLAVEVVPECPAEAESGRPWDGHGDDCPGSLDALLDFATGDIGAFWEYEMANHGLTYSAPARIVRYEGVTETSCGVASNLAFYCSADAALYFDTRLMQQEFDAVGPYGPVLILAHEWARLIQDQLALAGAGFSAVELELQAGCFAGAYARRPSAGNVYDETGPAVASAGVLGPGPGWSPFAAGSPPDERVAWFNRGLAEGLNSCFD